MRLAMVVEYDGTEYFGWQVQPDRPTIQESLERAVSTVLGHPVRVEGAGRTDTGVHATGQVAAFSTDRAPDAWALQKSVNALVRPAIVVREMHEVPALFDPRRHARRRTYEYRIDDGPWPSPFRRRFTWHVRAPLDLEAMASAAAMLLGDHDFRSFQAAGGEAENPLRRVFESTLARREGEIAYRTTATAFLRHMVRNVVGTLVEVGRHERTVAEFADVLAARNRRLAGPTAPARGLCLIHVEYA